MRQEQIKSRFRCGVRFFVAGLVLLSGGAVVCANEKPTVLFLNSYHNGYLFSDEIVRGVRDSFAGQAVELHIDYLDSKKQFDDEYIALMVELLKRKNRAFSYDLIISSDNVAFDLLKRHRGEIYGEETPVVFCGVNYLKPEDLLGQSHITGVNEAADIFGNVELIRRLHPERKQLLIITDESPTGQRISTEVNNRLPLLQRLFSEVELVSRVTASELTERLAELDQSWVVLYSFFFRDKNGRFFEYDDGARMVAESTAVPVYCLWDFSMNSGMVGGYLVCGYLQGLHAGAMALDILRGKPVAEVPVKYQPPLQYIFDYEALKRFGIPEDELPADRMLINRPLTLYAEYKRYFWGVVIGFPLMAAVILVLGHFLRRSRLAEAALRESKASLAKARNMLQSVMDGASETAIIATDCEGIIRLFNEGAVRLLGYDAGEMVGHHTPEMLFRREDLAARAASLSSELGVAVEGFRALVQPAEAIGFERREWDCVRKDGRVVVVSVITTVLREEGEAISGYLMVARDVTERKKSEQALEQVRIYISNVIDAMPSWLIGVEEGGRVMQWNLTAARESGIELKHAFGRPVDELLPFMRQQMVLVREALEAREVASALKIPVEKGDQTEYVNLTVYPLLGEGLTGAVLRIDNVTEQMKLEQRMIQSQKMDAIGQLAGGVAHDFNNLLGGILGFSEILERHVDEQGRHYVELMNSAAKRAADLTAKLLSFSRKGQLTRTPVDMHGLVHNTVGLLKRCLNKQVELSVQLNAPYCTVMGDEAQLHSALLNLGINAGHAMPNGGELLYASRMIELDRNHCAISPFKIEPGKYLEIEVRDHGVGISEEHIGHIFEPFYTTRSAGEGTGLGLAAVYGAVQEHKGAITVYSEVGVGTVFHLYFPLIKIEVGRVNSEEHPVKGEGRILVVDDEAVIRMTAEAILSGLGYEVSLARNGEEALEAYRAAGQEIDLVLLDMIMPGMNGHEVFDRLKDMDPAVKVLVCSGYSKPDDLRAMQARGCSGFIRKPYTTLELSRQVASCLFD